MKNTGIQPEVSCIMRIMDDGESDYALSDFEDEVLLICFQKELAAIGGRDILFWFVCTESTAEWQQP